VLYSCVKFLDQVMPVTPDINNQNLNQLLNELELQRYYSVKMTFVPVQKKLELSLNSSGT